MSVQIEVLLPQLNANDTEIYLSSFQIKKGSFIRNGQLIAEVETTKGINELKSPADGYFYPLVGENQFYKVGHCIGVITKEQTDIAIEAQKSQADEAKDVILTNKAKAIAAKLGIDKESLPKGVLLKEKDIIELGARLGVNSASPLGELPAKFEKALAHAKSCENPIIIIGAGATSKITIETIGLINKHKIIGILDSNPHLDNILGVPVIGYDDEQTLKTLYSNGVSTACNSVLSFYNLKIREGVFNKLKDIGFALPPIVHPRAFVEASASLGEGVFVHANAYVGAECKIGSNSFINTSAVISHDCVIGETVFLAPNSVVAGSVEIGAYSVVGMCATVLSGVKIGKNVFIANGKNVILDVPDSSRL